jgi:hypothetical protein
MNDVKSDLKMALKTESSMISRYEECFDDAHPLIEKERLNSNCDGFEKDIVKRK